MKSTGYSSGREKPPNKKGFWEDVLRTSGRIYTGGRLGPKTLSPLPGVQENRVLCADVHDQKAQRLDNRQITHLICVRLLSYDLFKGVLGLV